VCSPARRTRETAHALGLDAVEDAAFREQDFGDWTGRRHNDLAAELGETYREFWKSPAGNRPPGGESFVDQISRARTGLASLPTGDVVMVVHSGTVRALLAIALDLAPDNALRFVIDPLSLTRIDRLENGWRVGFVNQR
jgi:alpha-ribazole phosphatase